MSYIVNLMAERYWQKNQCFVQNLESRDLLHHKSENYVIRILL